MQDQKTGARVALKVIKSAASRGTENQNQLGRVRWNIYWIWLAGSLLALPFCGHVGTQRSLRWNAQVKRIQMQSKAGQTSWPSKRRCGTLVRRCGDWLPPGCHLDVAPEAEHLRELAAEEAEAAHVDPVPQGGSLSSFHHSVNRNFKRHRSYHCNFQEKKNMLKSTKI